jgi:hypothetical protein
MEGGNVGVGSAIRRRGVAQSKTQEEKHLLLELGAHMDGGGRERSGCQR